MYFKNFYKNKSSLKKDSSKANNTNKTPFLPYGNHRKRMFALQTLMIDIPVFNRIGRPHKYRILILKVYFDIFDFVFVFTFRGVHAHQLGIGGSARALD